MKMSSRGGYYRTIGRLLGNALGFRLARLRAAPLKPEVVSLAVTSLCCSRCIMCNIWRTATEIPDITNRELSATEIIDLFSRPLFSNLVELDLTGGEPPLRDDLAEIVLNIAALKSTFLPRLKTIVLTSNGLIPERIIRNCRKILEGIRGTGIDFVTVASIDGIGKTHDEVRGVESGFARAVRTIDGLLKLRDEYGDYFIGLKTTVLPQNIDSLDAILDFAIEKNLFNIISPVFFTEARFQNSDSRDTLELGADGRKKLLAFYNRSDTGTNYFYSRIREYLTTGRKSWSCTAAYNYIFIEHDGTVYPCELLAEPIGNIREQSIEDIWNGMSIRGRRDRTGKTEQCRNCIEPGAVRYSACAEGLSYLGFLRELGSRRYRETLDGEGFNKYIL